MRIGIDTLYESPAFPTGATGYMINLLRCLAAQDHENEYFIFVSQANRHLYPAMPENFHLVLCWASNENLAKRIAAQQFQIPPLVRKHKIDVFNSPGNTAPLALPCRSVLTIKTMHHYRFSDSLGWSRTLFRRGMVYGSAKRAERIIANSHSNRADIINYLGVPPEKVAIVHEAVDRELFQKTISSDDLLKKLSQHGVKQPFILNVSSMWRYKNQIKLVHAYHELVRHQKIPHQLVLIGGSDQPDYSAEIYQAIRQTGLQDSIHLLGYMPHSEILYFYRAADVFVYPSAFETFGLTLLEAMASGAPIVSSDRGSLPEILGDAGLLVNPDVSEELVEAIARVTQDRDLRNRLIEKGYQRVQEFSWERTAFQTREVFIEAAARN